MPASWWQERQPPAQKPNTGKWNRRCLSKAVSSRINRVIYTIPSFYFRSLDFSEQGEGTVKGYHLHVQGKWTHEKAKRAKRELDFPEISISEMYFEIITSPLAEAGCDNDLLMTVSCSHPISRGFHSHHSHTCVDLNTEDPYSKMQLSPSPQDSWGPGGHLVSVRTLRCISVALHFSGTVILGRLICFWIWRWLGETLNRAGEWNIHRNTNNNPARRDASGSPSGFVLYIWPTPTVMQREPWTWHTARERILPLNPSCDDLKLKASAFLCQSPQINDSKCGVPQIRKPRHTWLLTKDWTCQREEVWGSQLFQLGVLEPWRFCTQKLMVPKHRKKQKFPHILGELVGDMGTEPCLYFPKE